MQLHEKLDQRREKKGMSVRELARRLGDVSDTTVGRWMTGETEPRFKEVVRLARILGLSLKFLADNSRNEPSRAGRKKGEMNLVWIGGVACNLDLLATITAEEFTNARGYRLHFAGGFTVTAVDRTDLDAVELFLRSQARPFDPQAAQARTLLNDQGMERKVED